MMIFPYFSYFRLISKCRLIKYSPDLEEIDLRNNSIGNVSAKMLLNALEYRKLSKLKYLKISIEFNLF